MPDERIPESGSAKSELGDQENMSTEARFQRALEDAEKELEGKGDEHIQQLEEIAAGVHAPAPPGIDEEFDTRLRNLEEKAAASKRFRDAHRKRTERRLKQDQEDYRGLGLGLTIAYAILGMPVAGWFVGWLIDRNAGTQFWTPILAFVGVMGGLGFAISMLYRHQK